MKTRKKIMIGVGVAVVLIIIILSAILLNMTST